jgi:hypothetical protein
MSNDVLLVLGIFAVSASFSSVAATLFMTQEEEVEKKKIPFVPEQKEKVVTPESIVPSNCQGGTKIRKQMCHNPETGVLLDGTPDNCGPGKELWVPDPSAPGYVAAVGDGTCEGELRDCVSECPAPCSGGEWKTDPSDFCKIVSYDDSNPPQKIETRLDGTTSCGTGVVREILDETRNNFVEARGLGSCTKTRVGACSVSCPSGMSPSSGCAYYANRQKSANGCMRLDDNGNAKEYKTDGSNNVACGESGKQEYFYLPINASGCNKLSEWEPCVGEPCPINCVGNWRQASPSNPEGWEACTGSCGTQPERKRVYHVSTEPTPGGLACIQTHGTVEKENCGSVQPCCEVGSWEDGTCNANGFMTKTRTLKENSPGACANYESSKVDSCCYQVGNWTAEGTCAQYQAGKQQYKQNVAGNCPSGTDTKYEDCKDCVYKMQETNEKLCFSYFSVPHRAVGRRMVVTEPAVGTGGCPTVKGWRYGDGPLSIIRHIPSEMCDKTQDMNYIAAAQNNFEGLTWRDV